WLDCCLPVGVVGASLRIREEERWQQRKERRRARRRADARLRSERARRRSSLTHSLTDEDRKRLVAEVRELAGATLQKVWLPSPAACVLQFRVPGRTQLVVIDSRLSMAAMADERPTAPEGAPRSQATLRNAVEGATL